MYDEEQKNRIYAWRENNKEKYKEIQDRAKAKYKDKLKQEGIDHQLNYYYKHKEEILAKMKAKREAKREAKKQNKEDK